MRPILAMLWHAREALMGPLAVLISLLVGAIGYVNYEPPGLKDFGAWVEMAQRTARLPEPVSGGHAVTDPDAWHPPMRWRVAQADLALRFEPTVPPLLDKALAHLGTNPTGWDRLWCARFIALIAPQLAAKVDSPNLARSYAGLPKVKHPRPGVIVVLSRGKNPNAGHIGVVKAVKPNAVIVVSGNTVWNGKRRTVGINVYPMSRVVAFVDPRAA